MAVIKKFIPLESVKKGDLLLNYDGTEEVVESIEFMPSTDDVYNLEVSGNHNYYAEGILVHNKWGYMGGWKGDDKATEVAVAHDKAAWDSVIKSIDLLDEQAKTLQGNYGVQKEIATDIYQTGAAAQTRDYTTQKKTAMSQVGHAGLVSGTATENVDIGQEAYITQQKVGQLQFQGEQEKGEIELENSLFQVAKDQTDLYAGYISGMQSGGTVPEYNNTFSGGTEWFDSHGGSPATHWGASSTWDDPKMGRGCLPVDVKVDGKEISEVNVGDMVSSYNEETETVEKAEVIKTFRHKHDDGYLVINGRIKATANHPFYIRRNV